VTTKLVGDSLGATVYRSYFEFASLCQASAKIKILFLENEQQIIFVKFTLKCETQVQRFRETK